MKMQLVFIFIFLGLISSCTNKKSNTHEIELLQKVLIEQVSQNFKDVYNVNKQVKGRGMRHDDVILLDELDIFLNQRNIMGIQFNLNEKAEFLNFCTLSVYRDYLDTIGLSLKIANWPEKIVQLECFIEDLRGKSSRFHSLQVMVAMARIEGLVIQEMLMGLTSCMLDFRFDFNYNVATDKGDSINLIVYPTEINLSRERQIQYDSVQILNSQRQPVEHNLKVIGTAAYLTFESDSCQPCEFSALFKGSYDGDSTWYNQRLRKEIVITE